MNKTTKTTTALVMVAVAALSVLTVTLHTVYQQNAYAAQANSPTGQKATPDTDCLQAGPGNVDHNKGCTSPEDKGTDKSSDR